MCPQGYPFCYDGLNHCFQYDGYQPCFPLFHWNGGDNRCYRLGSTDGPTDWSHTDCRGVCTKDYVPALSRREPVTIHNYTLVPIGDGVCRKANGQLPPGYGAADGLAGCHQSCLEQCLHHSAGQCTGIACSTFRCFSYWGAAVENTSYRDDEALQDMYTCYQVLPSGPRHPPDGLSSVTPPSPATLPKPPCQIAPLPPPAAPAPPSQPPLPSSPVSPAPPLCPSPTSPLPLLPGHATVVSITMRLAGDVNDFTPAIRQTLRLELASLVGLEVEEVELIVSSSSVLVEARFTPNQFITMSGIMGALTMPAVMSAAQAAGVQVASISLAAVTQLGRSKAPFLTVPPPSFPPLPATLDVPSESSLPTTPSNNASNNVFALITSLGGGAILLVGVALLMWFGLGWNKKRMILRPRRAVRQLAEVTLRPPDKDASTWTRASTPGSPETDGAALGEISDARDKHSPAPTEVASHALHIDPSELQLFDIIGEGGMGRVYASSWMGSPVATKLLSNTNEWSQRRLMKEARILTRLRHPNICSFFGALACSDSNLPCPSRSLAKPVSASPYIAPPRCGSNWTASPYTR